MANNSFRAAMRSMIGERWEDVWELIPRAKDETDIDGVHDVRVASRRLRAAMDAAAPAFHAAWFKPLLESAKEITAELSDVRDRDVMLEYLTGARDQAPPNERPGIERLIARVERERATARIEMDRFLSRLATEELRMETRRRFPPSQSDDHA